MEQQEAHRKALKNYRVIAKAYYRLLRKYLSDENFHFLLSCKELEILGHSTVKDFRGEWEEDGSERFYEPSDWEYVPCAVVWDKPTSGFYRDDLRYYDCENAPIEPVPEDSIVEYLEIHEPAIVLSDLICGWLKRRSKKLESIFEGWPGLPLFEDYFPERPSQIQRYTLDDVEGNESEYLCRIGNVKQTAKIPDRTWKPLPGYIGAKTIEVDHNIPRSTLQGWTQTDHPHTPKDPFTQVNTMLTGIIESKNIPVLIIANKTDLEDSNVERVQSAFMNYDVIQMSALHGDNLESVYEQIIEKFNTK